MKKSKKVWTVASAICILAGASLALKTYLGYLKGRMGYQNLADTYTFKGEDSDEAGKGPDDPKNLTSGALPEDAPKRTTIDWGSFLKSYPDCVAWLELPTVEIFYPVMQSENNDYYLHHSPEGEYLYAGSIFMDCQCSADFSDFHTILYGHNMRDGSMFGKLKQYSDADVVMSCPYFWIYTPEGDYLYRIYSIHKAEIGCAAFSLKLSKEEYGLWVTDMLEASEIETEAAAETKASLEELLLDFYDNDFSSTGSSDTDVSFGTTVTLSTCTGVSRTRQLLQGYLVGIAY